MAGSIDRPVADLTVLRFDVYLEENDSGAGSQPYLNLKIDADNNGTIDTTLLYSHTPIPVNTWTPVDTLDGSASGSTGWTCLSSTVVTCPPLGPDLDRGAGAASQTCGVPEQYSGSRGR